MLRARVAGASLAALIIGTSAAVAADMYSPPPEIVYDPNPAFTWTGGYVGGIVGYGWGSATNRGNTADVDGVVGGVFGGYNFQPMQDFVLGLETDIMASGMDGKAKGVHTSNNWNGTLRARAGFAFDRFLAYGTAGLAVGGVEVKNGGKSDTEMRGGYAVGAGMEAALTDTVIGRLEYRYTDLGKDTYNTKPNTKVDYSSSQLLLGVGVKF